MAVESFIQGINIIFSGSTLFWLVTGVLTGILVGMVPGIGPTVGMAIVLPITIPLEPVSAIIFLVGIYSGGLYGGSIPAILLNIPGTSAAAATTFDGYPLAQQGKAFLALSTAVTASVVGGTIAILTLLFITPFIVEIVLLFQSADYFLVALLGIVMISVVARGSMLKGLIAGLFGLLITTIGIAPMTPELRYTFDMLVLYDGIDFLPALLGLFAIAEMMKLSYRSGGITEGTKLEKGGYSLGLKQIVREPVLTVKSAYIGMGIGSVPGAGAAITNFIAYGEAMRSSKDASKMGEGDIRGVIASESSNNATIGGSLIPTLSFGIPGSGASAVLLGGLLLHGLDPGPDLFTSQLDITYSIFVSVLIGEIVILIVGLSMIDRLPKITQIDTTLIIPIIVVLSIAGGYIYRTNWVDVFSVVIFGILGYYMIKNNYSIIAFLLGIILGPLAEENFLRALQVGDGSLLVFVQRPLSILLLSIILLIFLSPLMPFIRKWSYKLYEYIF